VNLWLIAAAGMVLCLVPCAVVCLRGEPLDRLVGLETAATISTLALMLLAAGGRVPVFDLPLALALLSFTGGLVFTRFLERWM
jgi:multisubunit Na+/H+ antiporter MnhF subunit